MRAMADRDTRSGALRYATAGVLEYVDSLHAKHDPALGAAFDSPERDGVPAIQVGISEGKTLELLVRLAGARKVVEIGTLAGYSAIRIARALPDDGKLWTIEADPKHAAIARRYIDEAGLASRVEVLEGRALDVLPRLERLGPFDVVFIDADKTGYDAYGRWAASHLRPGGIMIADNAYLFGQLLEDRDDARAMRRFHEETAARFDSVCVPTPDGLVLGILRGA